MALPDAEWRTLSRPYEAYDVSELGDVRRDGRVLKARVDRYGYKNIKLCHGGTKRWFKVHRLVCEAFTGPCPEGHQCAHLDNNPLNNSKANLRWVTPKENNSHKRLHSRPNGGRNFPPMLSEEQVKQIRQGTLSLRETANKFGVSFSYVSRLRNFKRRGGAA